MNIKYALRNIKKRPVLNLIKILGLSLGLCGVLFIALFVKNEFNYDQMHTDADRIFRLTTTSSDFAKGNHFARIPDAEIIPELLEEVPEVEKFVRLMPLRDKLISKNEQYYGIAQAFAVDANFLDFFEIHFINGERNSAFSHSDVAVISETLARKVFGEEDPIGKVISLPPGQYNSIETNFTVKGVMEDFAQESHMHPDLLIMPGNDTITGWAYVYLMLEEQTSMFGLTKKLSDQLNRMYDIETESGAEVEAHLMNIKEIHLKSHLLREIEPNGSMSNIYVLVISALILLFISLSNFAALNLGMASYFTKFLALNQLLGSSKRIVTNYFLVESAIVLLFSLVFVFVFSFQLNRMIFNDYQINLFKGNESFVLGVVLFFSVLSLLAGLQPVFKNYIQNFTLGKSIKGEKVVRTHKFLLISQFTLAIVLLVGVVVISRQTDFALGNAMGAKKDNILCIPYVHADIQKTFDLFKAKILNYSSIESVSAMMAPPGGETNDMFAFEMQELPNEKAEYIGVFSCDNDMANVFGLAFIGGQNFSDNNTDTNGSGEYIINETALHYLGYQDPKKIVSKDFTLLSPVEGVYLPQGKIIGVVDDFHISGLQTKVEPLVLFKRENMWLGNIVLSYVPSLRAEAISNIQKTWSNLYPKYPLDFYQVSALYENVYKIERLQKKILMIFAFIAVFVCAMGVLGLSLMVAQKRFKEIGIRKVNGASIFEILVLLNVDFLKGLVLAFVMSTPIAYWAATKWLENFAYKINVGISMFLMAGGTVILITILTVSWHSYKAAKANPVKSLRTE